MSNELVDTAPAELVPLNNADDEPTLSSTQVAALDALLSGKTATEAARAAGVGRTTVHKWMRQNGAFRAAVNRGRKELREAVGCRLEQLAADATECMGRAIREGNVKAATELLKRLNLLAPHPIGSDDELDLELEIEATREERHNRLVLASMRRPELRPKLLE